MKYPPEVQEKINVLNAYKENDELESFNIIHMYPKKLAYPTGYYDARYFELIAFNTSTMEKKSWGTHDAVFFENGIIVDRSIIFADGSTLIKFKNFGQITFNSQAVSIEPFFNNLTSQ